MASLTTRSENLDVLKTRRLILQNQNGTYPAINAVPIVADSQGTIGFSSVTIDPSGNINVIGSLNVEGSINSVNPAAYITNIAISNQKPSLSGTGENTAVETNLWLQPGGGRVSVGTNYNGVQTVPPTRTFEVNGSTILRNGLVVQDTSGCFTVDASGNVTIKGNLVTNGSIRGSISGSDISGNISGGAGSFSGDICGNQVIGDICGGAFYVSDGGYVNTYLLRGTIPGSSIQGDISGNARTITGSINGSQVLGSISGGAAFIIQGGSVIGEDVDGDIDGGARYIRQDGGYVFANQIIGDTSGNATWYKGFIDGAKITGNIPGNAFSITGTIDGTTRITNGVPTRLLVGDISAGQTGFSMDGSRIIVGTLRASDLSGSITAASVPASQITGQIPAGAVFGDLSNCFIRGDRITNDISGSNLRGPVYSLSTVPTATTLPVENIIFTPNYSIFSTDLSSTTNIFYTPGSIPASAIYSLFVRISPYSYSGCIFTTGYFDNQRNWIFTSSTSINGTITISSSNDGQNILLTGNPSLPSGTVFYLNYSLVSGINGQYGEL